ncbi:MAG: acyl-CoA dehydrogenase family protein [Actinomycetota bacterium]
MTMKLTTAGEIGLAGAAAVREIAAKAVGTDNISMYIESDSPVSWDVFAEGGWDLAGVIEDEDSASVLDLAEIARAWGESCLQLPLISSLLAKRYSESAREADGPVTVSVPTAVSRPGWGVAVFGQVPGISLATGLGSGADALVSIPEGVKADFAPSLLAVEVPVVTEFSPEAANAYAAVLAAEAGGAAAKVVRDAVAFVSERTQFGKPIGSFQAVKHHLANAHIAAEQAETAAIWAGIEPEKALGVAHHGISQAVRAIELAIQVHGGLGFTWEMGIHFYLRHVLSLREMVDGLARRG